ncbi:YlcG family protein, partial [Escherichia coli]|nr:YlcG family protein [Escherichia coli]
GHLRLYRFPGSVLTDYRILKNYAKTLTGAGV